MAEAVSAESSPPRLAARSAEPTDEPEAATDVAESASAEAVTAEVIPGTAEVTGATAALAKGTVELAFTGVGPLHKNFFSQSAPLGTLVEALGDCVDQATVRVSWEEEIRLGHITLEVAPDKLRCAPALREDGLDLSSVEPIGRALANYRDMVAGTYDFRVASFRVAFRMVRPGPDCLLKLGGDFPPDGSRWNACVEIGDRVVCGTDEDDEGVVHLRPPAGQVPLLRACTPQP